MGCWGAGGRGAAETEHRAHVGKGVVELVAEVGVALFKEGPPTPRMNELVVRPHRGRAGPHFVIKIIGWGGVRRIVSGAHVVITADLDQPDPAELAFLDDGIAGLDEMRRAAALGSHLYNPLMFSILPTHL